MPSKAVPASVVITLGVVTGLASPGLGQATRPAPGHPEVPSRAERVRSAPAAATQPSHLGAVLRELDHRDADVRGAAVSKLLNLVADDLPALRDAVRQAQPLTPNQVAALRDVVTQVFLEGQEYPPDPDAAGFLGLMQPATESVVAAHDEQKGEQVYQFGVPVGERLPGFCAYRALRPGDIVVGIFDRRPVRVQHWMELQAAVRDARPGETVTFEVVRQGRLVQVPIKLDARPRGASTPDFAETLRRRDEWAEQYWRAHFAPLVGPEMS
jgi:S1-C subfamily serine protease